MAVEVKNFAKITFLSFSTTAVFLHDVMMPENDVLEAWYCSWCIFVSNFEQVSAASRVNKSQPIGKVVFVKSPLFHGALQTLAVMEKVISTRKA